MLVFNTIFMFAIIAAAVIIFGGYVDIKDIDDVLLYRGVIYNFLALCAVLTAAGWLLVKKPTARLFVFCAFAFLFIALAKPGFITISRERSTQQAAQAMLKYVNPQDIIVNYDIYYQDSPFYFKRRVIITDWIGELEYGVDNASPQDRAAWIIDDAGVPALLARPLANGQKMYFIVRDKSLKKYPFKQSTKFIEKINKYNIYVREQ
jgi:hypothetical protein